MKIGKNTPLKDASKLKVALEKGPVFRRLNNVPEGTLVSTGSTNVERYNENATDGYGYFRVKLQMAKSCVTELTVKYETKTGDSTALFHVILVGDLDRTGAIDNGDYTILYKFVKDSTVTKPIQAEDGAKFTLLNFKFRYELSDMDKSGLRARGDAGITDNDLLILLGMMTGSIKPSN